MSFAISRWSVVRATVCLALPLALNACSAAKPEAPPLPPLVKIVPFTPLDISFVQRLNDLDLTHTALAQLAKTHAGRSDLASLALVIETDLTQNKAKLDKLAAAQTLTLAAKPSAVHAVTIAKMGRLHGAAFDRSYSRAVTQDYTAFKPVLEQTIATSKNTDLVALAKEIQTKLVGYQSQL